ncbi:MAG: type II toxin-antitoxin system HigB family toxin [Bacteroidetes bacterium]|nr:type II toxin-antitoxin system HigB family toxin [Bacteroidota bacterium]
MRLTEKKKLEKLKRKNKGNKKLSDAIDNLIDCIESNNWNNPTELKKSRIDTDCVHSDGFYFFNVSIHRTMIMVEFDDKEATVVWIGNHQEYVSIFNNNKNTIKKWLRTNDWI